MSRNFDADIGLRRMTTGSALPSLPQSVPRGRSISWLHWFACATACQVARPPVRIRLEHPAFEDFYFQASNGSVALPVAGYNYNSDWTPLLAGLWAELPGIFATRTDVLSPCMLRILEDLSTDWHRLDARIADLSSEIEALARQDKGCARLMTVPGIGPVISRYHRV